MRRHHHPAALVVGVGPAAQAGPRRITQVALAGATRGHRIDRITLRPQHADMAEEMLAILGTYPDNRLLVADLRHITRNIADVGEQITPLRRQEIDQVQPLGLPLEPGRSRREEVDVRIGRHPAPAPPVERPLERQRQFALSRLDRHLLADRPVLEPLTQLHVHVTDRQFALERAIHVGVFRIADLEIVPVVLEPILVHLMAVSVGREVASVRGAKVDADRCGLARRGVTHHRMHPRLVRGEQLDAHGAVGGLARPVLIRRPQRYVLITDGQSGVRAGGHVHDQLPGIWLAVVAGRPAHRVTGRSGRLGQRITRPSGRIKRPHLIAPRQNAQVHGQRHVLGGGTVGRERDAKALQPVALQRVLLAVIERHAGDGYHAVARRLQAHAA